MQTTTNSGAARPATAADVWGEDHDYGVRLANPAVLLREVPLSEHPEYGIYMGWSVVGILLGLAGLATLAALTQSNLLFIAASLGTSVFFVSVVMPGRMVFSAQVHRQVPENGIVSEPMVFKYTVVNTRRHLGIYSIRLVELVAPGNLEDPPRAYIPYLGPGESCTFQVLATPMRRGVLKTRGVRVASRFPFGLMTRFWTLPDPQQVAIYPPLGKLRRQILPERGTFDFHLGTVRTRYRGSSEEFYALREYRQGDNPRLIHWKRSAQTGELLVREMTQFAPHRFVIILDTYLPDLEELPDPRFEQAVSFVATVLCQSLEVGYRVTLVCATSPPVIIPPLAGREAQHRILRTLSDVQPQSTAPVNELARSWRWQGRWRGRGLLVALSEHSLPMLGRVAEQVGSVQALVVGSPEWASLFAAPPILLQAKVTSAGERRGGTW